MLAGLHQRVRLGSLRRGKRTVHDRANLAGCQQRPHLLAQGTGNRAFERHGPRPQRGAGDGETAAKHETRVQLGLDASLNGNDHQAPILGETFDLAGDVIACDHVQHHIHPLPPVMRCTSATKS